MKKRWQTRIRLRGLNANSHWALHLKLLKFSYPLMNTAIGWSYFKKKNALAWLIASVCPCLLRLKFCWIVICKRFFLNFSFLGYSKLNLENISVFEGLIVPKCVIVLSIFIIHFVSNT